MRAVWIALVFGGLAAVFLIFALVDYTRHGPSATPARKAWLRVGVIFAAVAVLLVILQAGR
jgi:hypothetical protein